MCISLALGIYILLTCKGHTCWYAPRPIEGPSFVSNVLFCFSRKPFLLPLFLFVCLHSCCLFVYFLESVVSLLLHGHSEALSDLPLLGTMDLSHSVITMLFVCFCQFLPSISSSLELNRLLAVVSFDTHRSKPPLLPFVNLNQNSDVRLATCLSLNCYTPIHVVH